MTAIIATMNKNGIAVAADSAWSVWAKIFSANKIFQLDDSTVGVAIYWSSEFMQIPMQIIITSFKKYLWSTKFQSLGEYRTCFLEYLVWFVSARGTSLVIDSIVQQIWDFLIWWLKVKFDEFWTEHGISEISPENAIDILDSYSKFISDALLPLQDSDIISWDWLTTPSIPVENGAPIVEKVLLSIKDRLPQEYYEHLINDGRIKNILELSMEKISWFLMLQSIGCNISFSTTGCVFFGYWESEIYPVVDNIELYYMLDGKIVFSEPDKFAISNEYNSAIRPYAQRDMVFNLATWISPVLQSLLMKQLDAQLVDKVPAQELPVLLKQIQDELENQKNKYFTSPILTTLAYFSVGELARISETFVNLTSFKKRVTMANEDVGWPTDVVIVSKNDGFKWIVCKNN